MTDGTHLVIHEAALWDYPAMQLHVNKKTFLLTSNLVPDAVGNRAYAQTPFQTPWRTIIVATNAADILASRVILNLNEPCAIKETSWIKPQKMVGVWWQMHIGTGTWDYAYPTDVPANPDWSKIKPHGMHAATTANTKKFIDFAASPEIQAEGIVKRFNWYPGIDAQYVQKSLDQKTWDKLFTDVTPADLAAKGKTFPVAAHLKEIQESYEANVTQ